MELSEELSKIIYKIRRTTGKDVRYCIWLDDSSIFENEVISIIHENNEFEEIKKSSIKKFMGINIFYTKEKEYPKEFNCDDFDIIFWMIEETVTRAHSQNIRMMQEKQKEQEPEWME